MDQLQVVKRGGVRSESLDVAKLKRRFEAAVKLANLQEGEREVSADLVVDKTVKGLHKDVPTDRVDELLIEVTASLATHNPGYLGVASALIVSALHKRTDPSFAGAMQVLFDHIEERTKKHTPLISAALLQVALAHKDEIDAKIVASRDFCYDFFGISTLLRVYLTKSNGTVVERPQYMLMRVALGIHCVAKNKHADKRVFDSHLVADDTPENLQSAFETYDLMSARCFTHASPVLFNAGIPHPQLCSCFLVAMHDDSLEGIYDTLKTCAIISKNAGGLGMHIHNIRAKGSFIHGTNGYSNGIVPMLKVYDSTARYVDQGGSKRPGVNAIYLEPWHPEIFGFLDLRKNTGKEELRCRDLFYGLWIPDLFMRRVENDEDWSLFCPGECPGLGDVWGKDFDQLYARYESEGKARDKVRAVKLWMAVLDAQIETGMPYVLFKDNSNAKSNQQNLGTIKSSNLCTEIILFSSPDETAVCNLGSVSLRDCVVTDGDGAPDFDHKKLYHVVRVLARNLDKITDMNYYPVESTERSNQRHRPIAVGVQGLADAFFLLRLPFDGAEAAALNKEIFETIYFAAVSESVALAKRFGTYESYPGSPVSQGVLQYDMWGVTPSPRWPWAELKADIARHGIRNSVSVALMPTAQTSQILGNYECFEPATNNMYTRRVTSGDFVVINRYLVQDLWRLGLWSDDMRNEIMLREGSVQGIAQIPQAIRDLYKTVWEIKQRTIIDMSADRAAFVDQSQSLNIHLSDATASKLNTLHFHAWRRGLKTGMYYLRTRAAASPIQFTVDSKRVFSVPDAADTSESAEPPAKRQKECDGDVCTMCSG